MKNIVTGVAFEQVCVYRRFLVPTYITCFWFLPPSSSYPPDEHVDLDIMRKAWGSPSHIFFVTQTGRDRALKMGAETSNLLTLLYQPVLL